jgi:hypothetical protein
MQAFSVITTSIVRCVIIPTVVLCGLHKACWQDYDVLNCFASIALTILFACT